MVIRKIVTVGAVTGITIPPPYLTAAKIRHGDIVTIELGRANEIIIKAVDLEALRQMRKENASRKN